MDLGLKGKRALVTGASQGIGRAIAEALAREGADLIVAARTEARLRTLAADLSERYGGTVDVVTADLSQGADVERLAGLSTEVDLAVNNAGAIPFGSLSDVSAEAWRAAWALKPFGYFDLTRALYAGMKRRGGGAIVLVGGIAGDRPVADYIAGTAGNAAVAGFARALGGASLADGIRVNVVSPGPVLTDRLRRRFEMQAETTYGNAGRWRDAMSDMGLPNNRAADPGEVADLVAFVLSDRARYISGTVLTIDGGISSANRM